jgi:hypothetical protein
MGGEGSGLLEQAIDEGGLAMIDVRDDGDVTDRSVHGGVARRGPYFAGG